MGLLILNAMLAFGLVISLFNIFEKSRRGTNTVTRFVRNSVGFFSYGFVTTVAFVLSLVFLMFGFKFKAVYAPIPTMCVIPMGMLLRIINTNTKRREKDARTVTKAGLRVGGVAGGTAASAAVISTSGNIPLGIATGLAVNEVAQISASNMCDVEIVKHPEEDHPKPTGMMTSMIVGGALTKCKPEEFLQAAERVGIATEDRSMDEVVSAVLQSAPIAILSELPDDMSDADKAMTILGSGSGKKCIDPECIHHEEGDVSNGGEKEEPVDTVAEIENI